MCWPHLHTHTHISYCTWYQNDIIRNNFWKKLKIFTSFVSLQCSNAPYATIYLLYIVYIKIKPRNHSHNREYIIYRIWFTSMVIPKYVACFNGLCLRLCPFPCLRLCEWILDGLCGICGFLGFKILFNGPLNRVLTNHRDGIELFFRFLFTLYSFHSFRWLGGFGTHFFALRYRNNRISYNSHL